MRITLAVCLTALLSTPTAAAQTQGSWADKMFAPALTHDFGSIPHGAQLYHRFKVTNIYAVRLEIMTLRTSCGCVSASTSTRVLDPHESGFVDVTMDARRFTGAKQVSVFVTVGPEYTSTATLVVSANSRPDVVLNPGEANFGITPRGQTPGSSVDVEYAGSLDWRVSEVAGAPAPLEVKLSESYRRPGQVGYQVKLTLKTDHAEAPTGPFRWELLLKTNDPTSPTMPLVVVGTIQAALSVQPNPVNLGTVKVGDQASKKVVVRGTKPFKVLAIEGAGEDLTAELPTHAAAVHIVTVKFKAAAAGDVRRQLTVKTDLGTGAAAPIAVEGKVLP